MSRGAKFVAGAAVLLLMASPFLLRAAVKARYSGSIYSTADVPSKKTAVVFGAAVYGNRLSSVLRDRVATAVDLYKQGKVDRIIMSGGRTSEYYNEAEAMRAYAIEQGIPRSVISADFNGHRTYDSCYWAGNRFAVDDAILVTQAFHLPRSLFTCRMLGIDAVGVAADLRPYRGARWYEVRETVATMVALWDVLRHEMPGVESAATELPE